MWSREECVGHPGGKHIRTVLSSPAVFFSLLFSHCYGASLQNPKASWLSRVHGSVGYWRWFSSQCRLPSLGGKGQRPRSWERGDCRFEQRRRLRSGPADHAGQSLEKCSFLVTLDNVYNFQLLSSQSVHQDKENVSHKHTGKLLFVVLCIVMHSRTRVRMDHTDG